MVALATPDWRLRRTRIFISTKEKKIEELEQKLYVNAQGEDFRDMRPVFTDER